MMKFFRKEGGFTLVELLVVIVVLGLLIAIAIPTFRGVRDAAKLADARANVKVAHTAAKVFYAQNDGFGTTETLLASINDQEPQLGAVEMSVVDSSIVSAAAGTTGVVVVGTTATIREVATNRDATTVEIADADGTVTRSGF